MVQFPHERSLVQTHADKPFALIGVNSDTDKKMTAKRMERYEINWRSFSNGPKGPRGPISKALGIPTWPYSIVLDADGVIRYKDVHGEELDEAIEVLLSEIEEG